MKRQHPIRDGTITTVLGGILLAFLTVERLRDIAIQCGLWFSGQLGFLRDYLGQPVTLSRWVAHLGALLLSVLFFVLLLALRTIWRRASDDFHSYTSDAFFGLVWRWDKDSIGDFSLRSFCPRCDMELYPRYSTYDNALQFTCEHCGFTHQVDDMDGPTLNHTVIRAIQRKVRTGEWRQTHPPVVRPPSTSR